MNGTAPDSVARNMILGVQDKYAGTDLYEEYDAIARNVTGVAYAGEYLGHRENPRSNVAETVIERPIWLRNGWIRSKLLGSPQIASCNRRLLNRNLARHDHLSFHCSTTSTTQINRSVQGTSITQVI